MQRVSAERFAHLARISPPILVPKPFLRELVYTARSSAECPKDVALLFLAWVSKLVVLAWRRAVPSAVGESELP